MELTCWHHADYFDTYIDNALVQKTGLDFRTMGLAPSALRDAADIYCGLHFCALGTVGYGREWLMTKWDQPDYRRMVRGIDVCNVHVSTTPLKKIVLIPASLKMPDVIRTNNVIWETFPYEYYVEWEKQNRTQQFYAIYFCGRVLTHDCCGDGGEKIFLYKLKGNKIDCKLNCLCLPCRCCMFGCISKNWDSPQSNPK